MFVLRNLDGRLLCILSCMVDVVAGREIVEECWVDRLTDATRFLPHHRGILEKYPDCFPVYLSGVQG